MTAVLEDTEYLAEVEEHADKQWTEATYKVVTRLINQGIDFTADDVWAELARLDTHTHEPRALGAVFARAAKRGYIEKRGYVNSTRRTCHGRPIPIWHPLIGGVELVPGPPLRRVVVKHSAYELSSKQKLESALKHGWNTLDELSYSSGVPIAVINNYLHYLNKVKNTVEQKREAGQYYYRLAS